VAGALWIVALMLLINADVIGRNAFGAPVRGVSELVGLSIVGIVFLQLADTLRCGRFTRAALWLAPLRRRRPALAAALQALHAALGAVLMVVMLWAAWPQFLDVARVGEYVGALGDFTVPLWPVRLLIVLGLGLTALTFAFMALALGRRAWRLRHGAHAQPDGAHP
jgi:TRAP-type mannitol/chloroaromatic compound transport system permease small subunit